MALELVEAWREEAGDGAVPVSYFVDFVYEALGERRRGRQLVAHFPLRGPRRDLHQRRTRIYANRCVRRLTHVILFPFQELSHTPGSAHPCIPSFTGSAKSRSL